MPHESEQQKAREVVVPISDHNSRKGQANGKHKLTAPQVRKIRKAIAAREQLSAKNLARRFGVSHHTIWNIGRQVTWSWLE
jgi:DNA-binding transcriptional regulator YiaG